MIMDSWNNDIIIVMHIKFIHEKKWHHSIKTNNFFFKFSNLLTQWHQKRISVWLSPIRESKATKAKVKMGIQRVAIFEWSFPFGSFGHHSYHRMQLSSLKKLFFLFHAYYLPTQITKHANRRKWKLWGLGVFGQNIPFGFYTFSNFCLSINEHTCCMINLCFLTFNQYSILHGI